jgi:hypothetical protein
MELLWFYEAGAEECCGFDLGRGSAGLWILHAMYERRDPAAGPVPVIGGGWDVDPGDGWRRLRWREVSERTGEPIVRLGHGSIYPIPSRASFPSVDFRSSAAPLLQAPTEGGLDGESFRALAEVLRRFGGPDAAVYAHWTEAVINERDAVFRGRLADLESLEALEVGCSPSNIWPEDHSWLVYTDLDFWGTKIYGPADLLGMIEADAFLETARLPEYRHMLGG